MAILKCKMCGGDLNVTEGSTVCVCEYCDTKQTVPSLDDEKKIALFDRANRLRIHSEFDKAYSIYESIVIDFPEEAEAYWGLVLCKYGIEYVDDPATYKKVPTCHRSSFESVLDDSNYEMAIKYADISSRLLYKEEAEKIEEIRKGIIEISSQEDPYDIFICYKETAEVGGRTIDSVIAQDVYDELTAKGYRVFFSRITLEDKLGREYEPYIFSALQSSRIMLAFGTKYDYFNAVWVKNEWSRFLKLIEKDRKKVLIPCYKDLDAYDMPKEFAKLQAQDMGKIGAIQDLLRGIEKILPRKKAKEAKEESNTKSAPSAELFSPILIKAKNHIINKDFSAAKETYKRVLEFMPNNDEALLGMLLAAMKLTSIEELEDSYEDFSNYKEYEDICLSATDALKSRMVNLYEKTKEKNIQALNDALAKKSFGDVNKFASNVLSFIAHDEGAMLAILLADAGVSSIEELEEKTDFFITNEKYNDLYLVASDNLKNRLALAHEKIQQNCRQELEKALNAKDFEMAEFLANSLLNVGVDDESIRLALLLSAIKVSSWDELEQGTEFFISYNEYEQLYAVAGDELKSRFASAHENVKLNCQQKANELLGNGDFEGANYCANRILSYFENDADAMKALIYSELEVSGEAEIEKTKAYIPATQAYARASNINEEFKEFFKNAINAQIRYLENAIEIVIEKGDFDTADVYNKLLQKYKVNTDKAIIAKLLLKYKAKSIEKLPLEAVSSSEFKKSMELSHGEMKIRLTAKEKAYKNKARKRMIAIVSSVSAALLVVLAVAISMTVFFTSESFVYGAKSENDTVTVTAYRGLKKDVVIPEKIAGKTVTAIDKRAFEGNDKITSIVIPDSVTTIGNGAFDNCDSLTSIVIPDSVTTIDDYAFANCDSLTSIVIPDSVTTIGDSVFFDCYSLTSIVIPDSVTTIDDYAFCDCDSLTSIVIPDSVTTIGYGAFDNCVSLTSVTIGGSVTTIGGSAFDNCNSLASIVIPDSVTTIGEGAFRDCYSLTSIVIPDSVTSIESNAFYCCISIQSATMPTSAIGYVPMDSLKTVVINGGDSIGYSAFSDCYSLTSVTIGDSVTTIGNYAFRDCYSLTSIVIPDSVTTIGYEAFSGCTSIQSATMPTIAIGYVPKNSLKTVVINGGDSIGDGAFRGCNSLTSIVIPDSVTTIGDEAFYSCDSLTSIVIPDSVTTIGGGAFAYCDSLTSITIPDSVTTIGNYAFDGCDSLASIVIPDSVTTIGDYAFFDCESLTSIVIPDSVTTIGSCAFSGCDLLASIVIPDSVTTIGDYAFYDCISLTIYCEAESMPSGWDYYWNSENCPVVWGYTGE